MLWVVRWRDAEGFGRIALGFMIPTTRFGRALGLILLIDAALLIPVLGRTTMSRIDETQIAEVAREMAEDGDWITPKIGKVPFAAYPPLQYWILTASGKVFGFNGFSMRVPTVLAALALVGVLAVLVRRLAGDDAGIAAGMILSTMPAFYPQSIVCRADIITLLFATAAYDRFLSWTRTPEQGGRKDRDLLLMYLWTALGILTKGPLAVAVLGLGGLSWFLLNGQWALLLRMKFWFGIPLALAIIGPWYYAVYRANGAAFLHENLFLENLNAYSEGYQQRRPWTFYLSQIHLFLPWLLALPLAATVRRSPGVLLLFAWFGLLFLFFQLSSAKRINYLVYPAPALAGGVGVALTAVWNANPALLRRCLLGLAGVVGAAGLVLAAIPPTVWTGSGISKVATKLPLLGGLTAGMAASVAFVSARFGACAGFGGITIGMALACFVFGWAVNPRMNPEYADMAAFCRRISPTIPAGEPVFVLGPEGAEGFWHYHMNRAMPLRNGEPGLYLTSQTQHDELRRAGKSIDILQQMTDHRGRGRYLLRVHP